MTGKCFWKFGNKWAGKKPSGKKFVVDTKLEAQKLSGSKSITKSKTKLNKSSKTKIKNPGGHKNMSKRFNTQKIYGMIRKGSLILPAVQTAVSNMSNQDKINGIIAKYTGYQMWDGKFNLAWLKDGWGPYIVTNVVTRAVPAINRILTGMF